MKFSLIAYLTHSSRIIGPSRVWPHPRNPRMTVVYRHCLRSLGMQRSLTFLPWKHAWKHMESNLASLYAFKVRTWSRLCSHSRFLFIGRCLVDHGCPWSTGLILECFIFPSMQLADLFLANDMLQPAIIEANSSYVLLSGNERLQHPLPVTAT
jgi:hypothetical protein